MYVPAFLSSHFVAQTPQREGSPHHFPITSTCLSPPSRQTQRTQFATLTMNAAESITPFHTTPYHLTVLMPVPGGGSRSPRGRLEVADLTPWRLAPCRASEQ